MRKISLFFLLALWMNIAAAFDVPRLTGPVMDEVGLLTSAQKNQLSQQIRQTFNSGNAQIQVLIVESLKNEAIESVAIQIFDQWKLGDAKKDNGVLLLIATGDRKLRIEVGQGLEGVIPDLTAKRIITDIIRPLFRTQNYVLGLGLAVQAISEAASNPEGTIFNVDDFREKIIINSNEISQQERSNLIQVGRDEGVKKSKLPLAGVMIFLAGLWFIIFLFSPSTALWILYALMSGGRGGGGSYGGGGWSGGGGSSSGGGASGDW